MTGVAPSVILDDKLLYDAFADEATAARWTDIHELLAMNAELTHAVFCQLVANTGNKPPEQLQIERPEGVGREPPKPPRITAGQFAAMMKGGAR